MAIGPYKYNIARDLEGMIRLGNIKKSVKVVQAVIKAIVTGLERDGRVTIQGFGTFKVVRVPVRYRPCRIFKGKINIGYYRKEFPAHNRVYFTPSRGLQRFVDGRGE